MLTSFINNFSVDLSFLQLHQEIAQNPRVKQHFEDSLLHSLLYFLNLLLYFLIITLAILPAIEVKVKRNFRKNLRLHSLLLPLPLLFPSLIRTRVIRVWTVLRLRVVAFQVLHRLSQSPQVVALGELELNAFDGLRVAFGGEELTDHVLFVRV